MRFLWSRVECEAAVGSNVRSVPVFCINSKRGIPNQKNQLGMVTVALGFTRHYMQPETVANGIRS